MSYRIRFTHEAEDDLMRLFDFLLEQDVGAAEKAEAAIYKAIELLEIFPFSCRKASEDESLSLLRELLIPFGGAGYVALFRIDSNETVTIIAVRHQREDDYH
ncbi:MAG: type II toxin-antitoxin system RelE/ParE family toxin [Gammaproteobacteria bacterium]|nr:type II toxin-antitoxin system RelE/ParE family toxin [Gammaproteobacteria bacterium]MBU1624522.1 type II toxin-antitoxin system RelE/ParE family toxin [Gammaproteobacteria bacterium]MBU1982366.1 type II toxin-antitoxin system RelE/ParE family toxin [Gammaproteobacteria bacterium]